MTKMAIGFLTSHALPLKYLTKIIHTFPNHYAYIINPSFSKIGDIHQTHLSNLDSLNIGKYKYLTKLCYF
jgi:hypothetical protein